MINFIILIIFLHNNQLCYFHLTNLYLLIPINSFINFKSSGINKLGGIEDSNLNLANNFLKLGINVKIACKIKKKIKFGKLTIIPTNYLLSKNLSQFCDILICSNTNKYFNKQKKIIKILLLMYNLKTLSHQKN